MMKFISLKIHCCYISLWRFFGQTLGGFAPFYKFIVIAWIIFNCTFFLSLLGCFILIYYCPSTKCPRIFIFSSFKHSWVTFQGPNLQFSTLNYLFQIMESLDCSKLVQFTASNQDIAQVYQSHLICATRSHSCVVKGTFFVI
jgi:hypothetical protein